MPRHCPKCDEVLTPPRSNECICGWSDSEDAGRQERPKLSAVHQTLTQIMYRWKCDHGRWPEGMPKDLNAAADWALKLFEGHKKNEAPFMRSGVVGKFWVWPYAERVEYLLTKFLHLDEDFQKWIVAGRHDRVAWRGEDKDTFFTIVNETESARKMGVDDYRKQCLALLDSR